MAAAQVPHLPLEVLRTFGRFGLYWSWSASRTCTFVDGGTTRHGEASIKIGHLGKEEKKKGKEPVGSIDWILAKMLYTPYEWTGCASMSTVLVLCTLLRVPRYLGTVGSTCAVCTNLVSGA